MKGIEFVRFILRIMFRTIRRVTVYGIENIPDEGSVLVTPNHVGLLDMFMIGYRSRRPIHWMAKQELFKHKIVSDFITNLGAYPVDRQSRDTGAARTTFELLEQGKMVGIFPEGTRVKKDKPRPKAKAGAVKFAVETDTTVLPVAIWGKPRFFGKMYIRFGKPFKFEQPPEGTKYDKKQYLEMAQKLMDDVYELRYKE